MEMREYIEAIAESCRKLIISKPATKQEEYRKIIVQKKEAFFQMEKSMDFVYSFSSILTLHLLP